MYVAPCGSTAPLPSLIKATRKEQSQCGTRPGEHASGAIPRNSYAVGLLLRFRAGCRGHRGAVEEGNGVWYTIIIEGEELRRFEEAWPDDIRSQEYTSELRSRQTRLSG